MKIKIVIVTSYVDDVILRADIVLAGGQVGVVGPLLVHHKLVLHGRKYMKRGRDI